MTMYRDKPAYCAIIWLICLTGDVFGITNQNGNPQDSYLAAYEESKKQSIESHATDPYYSPSTVPVIDRYPESFQNHPPSVFEAEHPTTTPFGGVNLLTIFENVKNFIASHFGHSSDHLPPPPPPHYYGPPPEFHHHPSIPDHPLVPVYAPGPFYVPGTPLHVPDKFEIIVKIGSIFMAATKILLKVVLIKMIIKMFMIFAMFFIYPKILLLTETEAAGSEMSMMMMSASTTTSTAKPLATSEMMTNNNNNNNNHNNHNNNNNDNNHNNNNNNNQQQQQQQNPNQNKTVFYFRSKQSDLNDISHFVTNSIEARQFPDIDSCALDDNTLFCKVHNALVAFNNYVSVTRLFRYFWSRSFEDTTVYS